MARPSLRPTEVRFDGAVEELQHAITSDPLDGGSRGVREPKRGNETSVALIQVGTERWRGRDNVAHPRRMFGCHRSVEDPIVVAMPALRTTRSDWTVEMVRQLPDDGNCYEVVDGQLLVSPAPSPRHLPPRCYRRPPLVTLVRMDGDARARAVADSLGTLSRKWLFGSHTLWRAAIHAELGEPEMAVDLLGQAYAQGYPKTFWHFANYLRSLRGFSPFEELIKTRP